LFNKILNFLFCYSFLLFSGVIEIEAYSQTNDSNKKELLKINNQNIKVSKLEKPSLGSLGIKTDANKTMGLDIWTNMKAPDIVEHLNYIPDILSSKSLHFFLSDLYLSSSNPPVGNSNNIIKF